MPDQRFARLRYISCAWHWSRPLPTLCPLNRCGVHGTRHAELGVVTKKIQVASWIELKSLRYEHQPTSPVASTAGGHATQRAEHGDVSLFKELDSASPLLYQALSGGTTFRSAQIDLYRDAGDGKRVKYLEIQLKHVLISQVSLDVGDGPLPLEMMSLRYAAIQWKYQKQNIDGGQGGTTLGAWSLAKNDKTFAVRRGEGIEHLCIP